MQQTACLVVNPITVKSYALLFNCTAAVLASDSMAAFTSELGLDAMTLARAAVFQLRFFI